MLDDNEVGFFRTFGEVDDRSAGQNQLLSQNKTSTPKTKNETHEKICGFNNSRLDVFINRVRTSSARAVHELTAVDVETFLDGIVPLQLDREDVAGAIVAVVKDGKQLFTKGYGYANVKNKKRVVAEETLFRPGSVSKLFTWTAVMQLVEQGKLDLNKDVNEYLDFKIPLAFGQSISLKNILTHTAGFEEQLKDLVTTDKRSPNLGNYLKTHIPKRIFAPGTTPAYSNYAAMLAGYVVERVSGQPFNDYIQQNIFRPLRMTRWRSLPEVIDFRPATAVGTRAADVEWLCAGI